MPQSDALAPQDVVINDVSTKRIMDRFTMHPLEELYLYKGDNYILLFGKVSERVRYPYSP